MLLFKDSAAHHQTGSSEYLMVMARRVTWFQTLFRGICLKNCSNSFKTTLNKN
jgi:hypothetical protein